MISSLNLLSLLYLFSLNFSKYDHDTQNSKISTTNLICLILISCQFIYSMMKNQKNSTKQCEHFFVMCFFFIFTFEFLRFIFFEILLFNLLNLLYLFHLSFLKYDHDNNDSKISKTNLIFLIMIS